MKLKISLSVAAVLLLAASSLFAAIPPAENLLPADTLGLVTVPDFSILRAASAQSPEWLLWNDPAMKPFHDDFLARWNAKFIAPMEQNLGIHLSDFLPLLQGQLTLAVTQNGWNGSGPASPALVVLLDARDKSDLLAKNLAALKDKWVASGRPVQSEILEGIKFSVVTFSTNAPLPLSSMLSQGANSSPAPNTLYIGQFESLLIAGSSVKAVASVAAHLAGGANPALKDNAEFAADRLSQFHDQPLYYGWFNAKTFFSVLSETDFPQDTGSFRMPWDKILLASGFNGLKSVSFTYREDHDGAQIEVFARAPGATRQGLLKIVAAAPKDASPPPFVPVDAVKFWRWRVDGQKSWAEIRKALMVISPGALTTLDTIIQTANLSAQQQDPNFDIRQSLINNLGDDWITFQKAPPTQTLADLNSAPWLFLFAANNADQAALAIKTVAGMSSQDSPPQTRDFLGRKIYTISMPGGRGANAASRSLYCAASGGYVAVTTDVSMMENYLRSDNGKTKPLSQKPGLVDAAQRVGGMDNGLFGYQNQRELGRELFAALKSDPSLNPLSSLPMGSQTSGLRDLMNFALLPDYGQVAKYFNFSVYGGSATSDGLDLKFFTPRPPELN
jgi:hypothetical protein